VNWSLADSDASGGMHRRILANDPDIWLITMN
jgi:hypothetical protein